MCVQVKSKVPWLAGVLKLLQETQELSQDLIDKVLYSSSMELYTGVSPLLRVIIASIRLHCSKQWAYQENNKKYTNSCIRNQCVKKRIRIIVFTKLSHNVIISHTWWHATDALWDYYDSFMLYIM